MNRDMRPSRTAAWLLRRASSRDAANAVVGDLLEELDARTKAGRAPTWPRAWLSGQTLLRAVAAARMAAARTIRALGLTVRDAARGLRRAPAHALFIIGILAVGMAAATVTFSVVDAVLLRPLPFDHSEALVSVSGQNARGPVGLVPAAFWAVHDHVPAFDGVGVFWRLTGDSIAGVGADRVDIEGATAECLRVLRLKPLMGRLWTADDEVHDPDVALIGAELWRSAFGADPNVLGRKIRIESLTATYRIVGVLPDGAGSPDVSQPIAAWVPYVLTHGGAPTMGPGRFSPIARLRPGVTIAQAEAQMQSVVAPLVAASPASYKNWRPRVERWDAELVGDVSSWLLLVLAIVGLIALVACVNVANVMLTRSAERGRDLAVRAALGASRRHLAFTVLAEGALLSSAATMVALVCAAWGIDVAKAGIPYRLFRAGTIALDGRVFAAAMVLAVVTALLCGIVPAWQASRTSVVALLKETTTSGRRVWRSVFLTAEVASIGVLLVVSTLFIGSFIRVSSLDLGLNRSNLLAAATITHYTGTVADLKTRLAHIPGIVGVAAVNDSSPPLIGSAFGGAYGQASIQPIDPAAGSQAVDVETYRVTPDYFDVARIAFRQGTTWAPTLGADATPLVIDDLAARRLFGDRSAVGQRVKSGGTSANPRDFDGKTFTIVGVVSHVFEHGPEGRDPATAYWAMDPTVSQGWVSFLLRTSVPAATLVRPVEASIAAIAPPERSAGAGVYVVDEAYRKLTASRRFTATLMSVLAIFTMCIGAAGIYAVMASVVAQRAREIGVRVALGATAGDIRRDVLMAATRHVLAGLAIGLPVAWWITRGFAALFFDIHPTDVSVYAIVFGLLAVVGLLAALVPARRAARVDPVVSLRAS